MPARSMRKALSKVESCDSESNQKAAMTGLKDDATTGTGGTTQLTPPPAVRKVTNKGDRGSPSTVQTAAESESINDAA